MGTATAVPRRRTAVGLGAVLVAWVVGWWLLEGRDTLVIGGAEQTGLSRWLTGVRDDIEGQRRGSFLLDTVVGLVSVEQNAIIKIFSVAAVIFMPPTLVASIYGMNFHNMPELSWALGYPWALGLMLLSALLPILFFRKKGWL